VALYPEGGRRWTMTERGRGHVQIEPTVFRVGTSHLHWDGTALHIMLDEWTAPWPTRLRGRIRVTPSAWSGARFALDAAARHRWTPLAPQAAVDVELSQPQWRWQGHGYLDGNDGDRALEEDFAQWQWSRAALADGGGLVFYDVTRRDGSAQALALQFDRDAMHRAVEPPPVTALAATAWGLKRGMHSDAPAEVLRTLESGPFYARSLLRAAYRGHTLTPVHESLSLDRFRRGWVQALLPFRMPRRG
jgi:carotenoid 1,2-hydratase